jgi:hypothetical protein
LEQPNGLFSGRCCVIWRRQVVDLGCSFGWFSRWADENGAASVLGVDVSTRCSNVRDPRRPARRSSIGWPTSIYLVERERVNSWFVDGGETAPNGRYLNTVIAAGLVLDQIDEWGPTAEVVEGRPELADDRHRPWFLLVLATKPIT